MSGDALVYGPAPPAMVDLPRHRLERRARFGHWPSFPVDPTGFYDQFRPTVDRNRWATEGPNPPGHRNTGPALVRTCR